MSEPSKSLILHIGFHKTGTSALQEALFRNAGVAAAAGVIYPKPLGDFQSHLELGAALFPEELPWVKESFEFDRVYDHYARLVDDAKPGSKIVLSTEELCRIDKRTPLLHAIHGKFAGLADTAVQIVAYTRDPISFLVSLYHHQIRVGIYSGTFAEFVGGHIGLHNVRFAERLAGWQNVFGTENVLIKDYDEVIKTHGPTGIANDFLAVLGKPDLQLKQADRRVNSGVHPWLVEAYRQLDSAGLDKDMLARLRRRTIRLGEEMPRVKAAEYYLGADGVAELRDRIERPKVPS